MILTFSSIFFSSTENEHRSSDNYSSRSRGEGGSGGGGGGGNGYEDENPYDGEREDSDQESHGGGGAGSGSSRRYYDRDQENNNNNNNNSGRSSATRTTSIGGPTKSTTTGVTTAAPVKVKPAVVQPKKIDLGAAATFGKGEGGLDIHSPTHTAGPTAVAGQRDLIDDFSDDLFNAPQENSTVGYSAVVDKCQEFGDFSSAFGGGGAGGASVQSPGDDDFADFSAFDGSSGQQPPQPPQTANNAFANIPTVTPVQGQQQQQQQSSSDNFLLLGMPSVNTLMAGGAVNNLMPMPVGGSSGGNTQQDLLADFGDLNLNQPTMGGSSGSGGGEYKCISSG